MSCVHALSAVTREHRKLVVVAEAAAADPFVPPAIAELLASAVQDLEEAAGLLRGRLDRLVLAEETR